MRAHLAAVPLAQHDPVLGGGAAQGAVARRHHPGAGDQRAPAEWLHVVRDVIRVPEVGVLPAPRVSHVITNTILFSKSPFSHWRNQIIFRFNI